MTLLAARAEREAGTVCIDELEVYIYVRQELDENQFARGKQRLPPAFSLPTFSAAIAVQIG